MKKKFTPPSAEHRRKYAERAAARSNEAQRAAAVKVTLPRLSIQDMVDVIDMNEAPNAPNIPRR